MIHLSKQNEFWIQVLQLGRWPVDIEIHIESDSRQMNKSGLEMQVPAIETIGHTYMSLQK